ncbi:MAG: hypothetical protein JWO20_2492 [Candidatus Angelobacter sp.]|nr:hypothetical protein [Candidatus Angelobacter sp.]
MLHPTVALRDYCFMKLQQIAPVGRVMIPIVCPLRFVQGYRCSNCPWARMFPECHVQWAVPICEERELTEVFQSHECNRTPEQLVVLQ